ASHRAGRVGAVLQRPHLARRRRQPDRQLAPRADDQYVPSVHEAAHRYPPRDAGYGSQRSERWREAETRILFTAAGIAGGVLSAAGAAFVPPADAMISVLVPVYNNEQTLEPLCARIAAALAGQEYEVLLVNDGSRDGSWDVLSRLAAANPRLKAIGLSRNFGQHPAIAAALDHASGDVIVLMDADLEDPPESIPALVSALSERRCDIVYTVKEGVDDTGRDVTSAFYHYVFSRIVGVDVPHRLGTFRAFTRKVALALRSFPERHVLYGPLMFFVGFRYAIVPVTRSRRV